jgi:hypothetical protein
VTTGYRGLNILCQPEAARRIGPLVAGDPYEIHCELQSQPSHNISGKDKSAVQDNNYVKGLAGIIVLQFACQPLDSLCNRIFRVTKKQDIPSALPNRLLKSVDKHQLRRAVPALSPICRVLRSVRLARAFLITFSNNLLKPLL